MYHSITFGDKNTWDDWHLIPSTRPVFNPPMLKSKYIDIPGLNGVLDISELFPGRPVFASRKGSLEFIVPPDHLSWEMAYSNIQLSLHGKLLRAVLEDDPEYFYEGRFAIKDWAPGKNFSTITIDYNVFPYKKAVVGSMEQWLWDPFNFETGVIPDYLTVDMVVSGVDSLSVELIGSPQIVVPKFTASAPLSVKYNAVSYSLPTGVSYVPEIALGPGTHTLLFSGTGTITIDYRGGSL